MQKYTQVPVDYLDSMFRDWINAFDRGEILNVFFMPYGDILFRAMQFGDWYNETVVRDEIKVTNLESELAITPESLDQILSDNQGKNKLVLIAKRLFFSPDGKALSSVIEKYYAKYGSGLVILHEGFSSEMDHFVASPVMDQHRRIWAIYPRDVTLNYIENTTRLWGVEVTADTKVEIAEYCGGIPWLVNDVLRRVEAGKVLFEDESFWWKVEKIWSGIPETYRGALLAASHADKSSDVGELRQFGLIDDRGEPLPFLRDWMLRLKEQSISIDAGKILFDGRDLTSAFSSGERRVLATLYQATEVVSRDEVGKAFWQDDWNMEYSDWALDQLVSRLRKKCQKYGLPITIQTKRGLGYVGK